MLHNNPDSPKRLDLALYLSQDDNPPSPSAEVDGILKVHVISIVCAACLGHREDLPTAENLRLQLTSLLLPPAALRVLCQSRTPSSKRPGRSPLISWWSRKRDSLRPTI